MGKYGVGLGIGKRRRAGEAPLPSLRPLSLSNDQIIEGAGAGSVVGAIEGATAGSAITLTNDAGGRFALSGGNIVAGATATDYETATSHDITLRETLAEAVNSPRDTVLTIDVGDLLEAPPYSITTPVIDTSSAIAGDNPPSWTIDFVDPGPDGGDVGDTIRLRYKVNGGAYAIVDRVLDADVLVDEEQLFPEFGPFAIGDVVLWNVKVIREAGVDESDWSAEASWTVQDGAPDAFNLVDQAGVATGTVITSAVVTPTGYSVQTRISAEGGEYQLNSAGAWLTSGVINPGDTVRARHTSAAGAGQQTNTVVTIGGVQSTFSSTTAGSALPAGAVLWLAADDNGTLFENIDATGAVADGDPVGTWQDKSGAGFHLTAAANDTTRPTYRANGGKPYLEFDGVDDFLRRLASLGSYAAGSCTVAVAMSSTAPAVNQSFIGEGNTADVDSRYMLVRSGSSTATRNNSLIRTDTNIARLNTDTIIGAHDGTAHRLILTDDGTTVSGYRDGVADTPDAYTRSGAITLNFFGIGGQAVPPTVWMNGKVRAIVVWNRKLDAGEIATVDSYLASKN